MKLLIPIIGILLLASCHSKVESDVHDTATDRIKEKACELEYAVPYMVAGKFISSDKVDTLFLDTILERPIATLIVFRCGVTLICPVMTLTGLGRMTL